jgi:hypothetical protein
MIIDSKSTVVVAGLIREYAVVGALIIGNAVLPPVSAEEQSKYYSYVRPGYFVVDATTGEALVGPSEQQWKEDLIRRGVSGAPQLAAPP